MERGAKGNLPPPNLIQGERRYLGKGAFVDAQVRTREAYFRVLLECLLKAEATNEMDEGIPMEEALRSVGTWAAEAHAEGNKVMFFGNGGSAAICSHMAIDWSKNGGVRSACFLDGGALTCLSNDYGYDSVYAKQIEYHARTGDLAIVISTSGRSLNLVNAANAARIAGCRAVVTLTGMDPNNRLRRLGTLNLYVPCVEYGLVELSHATLLHSIVSVPGA